MLPGLRPGAAVQAMLSTLARPGGGPEATAVPDAPGAMAEAGVGLGFVLSSVSGHGTIAVLQLDRERERVPMLRAGAHPARDVA